VHYAIALTLLAILPCNSAIAGAFFGALVIWYLVRLYYWKPYMLSGPMRVLVPGVLWIAYIALSLAWSPDTTLGFRGVWANRWILIVPALWPLMSRWRYLILAILIGSLIQAFALIIDGYMEWQQWTGKAVFGLNDHPRPSAAWIAATSVGVFGLYISGYLKRWFWLLSIVPFVCAIILSGSRGALLALCLGVVVTAVCLLATRHLRGKRLLSLAFCIVLLIGTSITFQSRILPATNQAMQATAQMVETAELSDIRLVWWKASLRQWQNHPIFGYGIGGTADAMVSDEQLREDAKHLSEAKQENILVFNQPHSTYFQVLLEGGLVGIGLLAFMLGSIAFMAIRTSRYHPIGSIALGGLAVWMVTATFDSWHTQGQTLALLWVAAIFASTHPACFRSSTSES
jgi:O-antigen ligase